MKKFLIKYQSMLLFALLVLLCSIAIKPLFTVGFFPMHDDEQIARLYELHKVLLDGQIPPRWIPDLGFGYGFPLYTFYPPLFYFLGEVIHITGVSLIESTKIILGLGFILSSLSMYLWVKNRFGKLAGIFASVLYTYVPYHAVDIYVRGAFAEFFSFVFIPASFWSLDKLAKKQSYTNGVLVSICLSAVVLTHNLVAMQAIPFFIVYILFLLFEQRKSVVKTARVIVLSGLVSLGLTAYFWIPSLGEKNLTLVDSILTKQLANYAIHFVCPYQLWNSPWGYGGSGPDCMIGLSLQVGKIHILLVALSIVILIALWKKIPQKIALPGIIAILLFAFSILLTTSYSSFVWRLIPPFAYIQFPWRFLLFAAVFSSFLGGFVIHCIEKMFNWKIGVLVVFILSCLTLYQIRNDFQPSKILYLTDSAYTNFTDLHWRVSGMSYEYVPKQVATRLSPLGTTELAINKNSLPTSTYQVLSGNMAVSQLLNKSQDKTYHIFVIKPGVVQLNTFSFPTWKVFVDGKQVRYNDNNPLHVIQVTLNPGDHTLEQKLVSTPIETLGNMLTLISALGIVTGGIYVSYKRYEKNNG